MYFINTFLFYTYLLLVISIPILILFAWIDKIKTERLNKQLNEYIEERNKLSLKSFKKKFRHDLIGQWISVGSLNAPILDCWIFKNDGSGKVLHKSLLFGESTEDFLWRSRQEFSIEISFLKDIGSSQVWIPIFYDFKKINTEYGEMIALVEIEEYSQLENEFGILNTPLFNQEINHVMNDA